MPELASLRAGGRQCVVHKTQCERDSVGIRPQGDNDAKAASLRAYVHPRIIEYGTLRAMTLAVSNKGAKDGAQGKNHGTSF